jgi:hypothetical protein
MRLKFVGAVVGLALLAGPAAAQTASRYDKLSADDRGHVDALYLAQRPVGMSTLSRDDIAAKKSPAGWNRVYDDLKAKGYYPATTSFADVVRSFHRPQSADAKTDRKAAARRNPLKGGARGAKAAPQQAGKAK